MATKCPTGFTTKSAGSSSATDCNVCMAGYFGTVENGCSVCPADSYCPAYSVTPVACPAKLSSEAGSSLIEHCFSFPKAAVVDGAVAPVRLWTMSTNPNDDGGGNTVFLSRHIIQCPGNFALKNFRLFPDYSVGKMSFVYTSVYVGGTVMPSKRPTATVASVVTSNVLDLAPHDVSCGPKGVINRWKLR